MDINSGNNDDLNPEQDIIKGIQKGGEIKETLESKQCLICKRPTLSKNSICLNCQDKK